MTIPTTTVQLSTSYIGTGKNLYHVSAQADTWDGATLYLVAGDSLEDAIRTAVGEHVKDGYIAEDFDTDGTDGYQIGVIL